MDHFMANIVTKLDSVMVIELTSDGFVQTSTGILEFIYHNNFKQLSNWHGRRTFTR